jgi:hypothetical protein
MAKHASHLFVGKSYRSDVRTGRPKKPADMKKNNDHLGRKTNKPA